MKTPESGAISVESAELRAKILLGVPAWAAIAHQPVGILKAGVTYRFSCRAKNVGQPGFIIAVIKDGVPSSPSVPVRVDGQTVDYLLIGLTTSLAPHTMDFQIHREADVEDAIAMLVFIQEKEAIVDDVSLRPIEKGGTP